MKTCTFSVLLALALLFVWKWMVPGGRACEGGSVSPGSVSAQSTSPVIPTAPAAPSSHGGVASSSAFHWSQIESDDYRVYIANLRTIGCPEATIRDIIAADLRALYHKRRAASSTDAGTPYWRAGFAIDRQEVRQPDALDAEEQGVLETLLGQSPASTQPATTASMPGRWLDGLAESTQARVWEGWQRLAAAKAPLTELSYQRPLTEQEETQLAALEQEQAEWLAKSQTPEERAEFERRNSPLADHLRSELDGVEVAESEFRRLFDTYRQRDAALAEADKPETITAVEQQYEAAVRDILGSERSMALLAEAGQSGKRPASRGQRP